MLSLLLTFLAAPLQPAPDNISDLRCLAVLFMVPDSLPEAARADITGAAMFFYGRIEGRTPDFDLEANLRPLMNPTAMGKLMEADLKRCSDEMIEHRGLLHRAGVSLRTLIK